MRLLEVRRNRADRIHPADFRHLQVHQSDIRPMRAELLHGLTPSRGFSHEHQIGLRQQRPIQRSPGESEDGHRRT